MLSVVPPSAWCLHIYWIGLGLLYEFFGSVGEESWWIGGADEREGSIVVGVLKDGEGILEGVEAVGDSAGGRGQKIGLSDKAMDNSLAHY